MLTRSVPARLARASRPLPILCVLVLAVGCARAPASSRMSRVVVLNFETNVEQAADASLGPGLADLLTVKLSNAPGVLVTERRAFQPFLGDAQRRPINWQWLGRRLRVDYIVVGSVAQLGRNYVVNTRLFDVQSGVIMNGSSLVRACDRKEDLYPTLTAMTRGITFHLAYLADLRRPAPAAGGTMLAARPAAYGAP
jgi:TolB-like protein